MITNSADLLLLLSRVATLPAAQPSCSLEVWWSLLEQVGYAAGQIVLKHR